MARDPETEALLRDCDVHTFRGSGPGGQHRNVTESAVRLVHRPTGIVVLISRHRSQHRNREEAVEVLQRRLLARARKRKPRVKTRPRKGAVQRRLESKGARSRVKSTRGRVEGE